MGFNRGLIRFQNAHSLSLLALHYRVLNRIQREWDRQESLPLAERTRGAVVRELSNLGPCFVKIGQTLSQRPDIVGDEAAGSSKCSNRESAFCNNLAMHIIASELGWKGPVAPGVVPAGADPNGKPMFASIAESPNATPSHGQVYRAELRDDFDLGSDKFLETRAIGANSDNIQDVATDDTKEVARGWEEDKVRKSNLAGKGRFVAVKVQRPEAVKQIALIGLA